MRNFVPVKVYSSRIEADVAKSVLESEGIDVLIVSDDAGGMRPFLQLSLGVEVHVPEEDIEEAQGILESYVN